MYTQLTAIGNSKGIRIPKAILEQCGFEQGVELRVKGNSIILQPIKVPRADWGRAFEQMSLLNEDGPLIDSTLNNEFDEDEWVW